MGNPTNDLDLEMDEAEREHSRYAAAQKWVSFWVILLLPSAIVGLWCLVWWLL